MLTELAGRVLAAGQSVLGISLLEEAAAREDDAPPEVRLAIEQLCTGEARQRPSSEVTIAKFAERLLSDEIAEQSKNYARPIRSADK